MGKTTEIQGTQDLLKSLGELDAAADELGTGVNTTLVKSDKDKGDNLKADEVAEGSDDTADDAGSEAGDKGDTGDEGDDTSKSMKEALMEQEDVQKALEVSEFLLALTEATSDAIENVHKSVNDSISGQGKVNEVLIKSINSIAKAQSSVIKAMNGIQANITTIVERLDGIERTPTVRKSVSTAPINVVERPLAKSVGAAEGSNLTKSQICSKMSDMLMKGDTVITPMDILSFESGAALRPEVKSKLGLE